MELNQVYMHRLLNKDKTLFTSGSSLLTQAPYESPSSTTTKANPCILSTWTASTTAFSQTPSLSGWSTPTQSPTFSLISKTDFQPFLCPPTLPFPKHSINFLPGLPTSMIWRPPSKIPRSRDLCSSTTPTSRLSRFITLIEIKSSSLTQGISWTNFSRPPEAIWRRELKKQEGSLKAKYQKASPPMCQKPPKTNGRISSRAPPTFSTSAPNMLPNCLLLLLRRPRSTPMTSGTRLTNPPTPQLNMPNVSSFLWRNHCRVGEGCGVSCWGTGQRVHRSFEGDRTSGQKNYW